MRTQLVSGLALLFCAACAGAPATGPNPFLDDSPEDGKADTGYVNPDGIEVEVDLEGDVKASSAQVNDAPAQLAQFALTYLRHHGTFYLESLAEDLSQRARVEWQVDGAWMSADQVGPISSDKLTHFRLRGINAVLLNEARQGVAVGSVFKAPVPYEPGWVFALAGDSCADEDESIPLGQEVYWYLWNPDKDGCKVERRDLAVTVSKMFPAQPTVYPEYDQLMADKKLTVVILYGQIGHDELTEYDPGLANPRAMAKNLEAAGFQTVDAPLGTRLEKQLGNGQLLQVDLYDARVFSGLDDVDHFDNFQRALGEHEIVVYDGHSMLGASDFWARPTYPKTYQIFLYGGCLGYEYYVRPILEGKGGWKNLDMLSSVVEVSADANVFAAPILNKIFRSIEGGRKSSWASLIKATRDAVGDSTFGASGVRDNCYTPNGTRCH